MEQKNESKPKKSFWKKFWYVFVAVLLVIGGVVLGVIFPEKSKRAVYGTTDAAKSGWDKVTGLFRKDNTACAESVDAEREEVREKFYNNNNRHNGYQDRRRS